MKYLNAFILIFFCHILLPAPVCHANDAEINDEQFFTLQSGLNLRTFGGTEVQQLLFRKHGSGAAFKEKQKSTYCTLKKNKQIQWSVSDLETGELLSTSDNANELFWGHQPRKFLWLLHSLINKMVS